MSNQSLRALWEAELDRLERAVRRAERVAEGKPSAPPEPWNPPDLPGRIPADLAERALDLLDRQDRVAAELTRALPVAQKNLAYAERLNQVTGRPANAVYLDLDA